MRGLACNNVCLPACLHACMHAWWLACFILPSWLLGHSANVSKLTHGSKQPTLKCPKSEPRKAQAHSAQVLSPIITRTLGSSCLDCVMLEISGVRHRWGLWQCRGDRTIRTETRSPKPQTTQDIPKPKAEVGFRVSGDPHTGKGTAKPQTQNP